MGNGWFLRAVGIHPDLVLPIGRFLNARAKARAVSEEARSGPRDG
jgi:hypothetical protein